MVPTVHLPVITVSEQKCFQRCPREHLYSYGLGVSPLVVAESLRASALVRKGLEAWWRAAHAGGPTETWLAAALAAIAPFDDNVFDRVRAEELVAGYHARWADEQLEVLGVGIDFALPLINPATGAPSKTFRLGDTITALIRRPSGQTWVVEHRTTSEELGQDGDYGRRLRLDAQVATFVLGARSLGNEVAGCLYDVIGRVKLQPYEPTAPESRKYKRDGTLYANQRERAETVEEYRARVREHIATNPERYFARGEVTRTAEDERDAAFDAWQTARAIADASRLRRAPRNEQACVRYGRTCAYFDVCTRDASLEDDSKYRKVGVAPRDADVERAA